MEVQTIAVLCFTGDPNFEKNYYNNRRRVITMLPMGTTLRIELLENF